MEWYIRKALPSKDPESGRPLVSSCPMVARRRTGAVPVRLAWLAVGGLLCGLVGGCAGGPSVRPGPDSASPEPPAPPADSTPAGEGALLRSSLDETRTALARAWEEVAHERLRGIELERRVLELVAAVRASEGRRDLLESDLAAAIDEVLRSKASLSGGANRALAVSRIAELRAAAQAAAAAATAGAMVEHERVDDLLGRAEAELEAANYPGAAYLAERAGELLRQARRGGEEAVPLPPPPDLVVPLVPAEPVFATQRANLRLGPGLDYERLTVLEVGEPLRAVARVDEWVQVERADGVRGWVHSRLTEPQR